MKGIPVLLTIKTQVGEDPFGAPVCQETTETVDNVLVAPTTGQEWVDTLNMTGRRAIYTLGIPKGDTHEWEDTTVAFFGQSFHTIGPVTEGIEALIPLGWNRKVQVERLES